MNHIINFLNTNPRNRLIILQDPSTNDFVFNDIGFELSNAITSNSNPTQISMFASEALESIINGSEKTHPIIGNYIALRNLGILMEEALKINIQSFFNRHSQNCTLIVDWEGEIDQTKLYFLSKKNGKIIDLKGISHIVI